MDCKKSHNNSASIQQPLPLVGRCTRLLRNPHCCCPGLLLQNSQELLRRHCCLGLLWSLHCCCLGVLQELKCCSLRLWACSPSIVHNVGGIRLQELEHHVGHDNVDRLQAQSESTSK